MIGLWGLAVPAAAGAEEADWPAKNPSRIRVMGNMGIASAIGEMGATLTYAPVAPLQIELGTGLGFSGLQFSVMPKLVGGRGPHRLSIGIGPSLAVGSNPNPSATCISYWLNAEAGYEYRAAGGFSFLLAVGVGRGMGGRVPGYGAPGVTTAGDPVSPEPASDFSLFPQGRIAFGRWF